MTSIGQNHISYQFLWVAKVQLVYMCINQIWLWWCNWFRIIQSFPQTNISNLLGGYFLRQTPSASWKWKAVNKWQLRLVAAAAATGSHWSTPPGVICRSRCWTDENLIRCESFDLTGCHQHQLASKDMCTTLVISFRAASFISIETVQCAELKWRWTLNMSPLSSILLRFIARQGDIKVEMCGCEEGGRWAIRARMLSCCETRDSSPQLCGTPVFHIITSPFWPSVSKLTRLTAFLQVKSNVWLLWNCLRENYNDEHVDSSKCICFVTD